jgi:hypothetical protein
MGKNMKWLLIALGVLIVLFGINKIQQNQLTSKSDTVFDIDRDDVFQINIIQGNDSISLSFNGESWAIDGNDTLQVKSNTMDRFFETVINVKRTSLVSKNAGKWDKFNVGDSTGTHLVLKDYNSEPIANAVVGRSSADWSASNIRIGKEVEVYQTNENISFQLDTSPTYWGEVPPPPKPDSTTVESL